MLTNRHTMFPWGQTGTLVYRQKFVPRKKCSLKKKGLHFESFSDFMVWITLPDMYVDKFCHIVADLILGSSGFGDLIKLLNLRWA